MRGIPASDATRLARKAKEELDEIPEPLRRAMAHCFLPERRRLVANATTFYSATAAAAALAPPERFKAVHWWVMDALIRDPPTRALLLEVPQTELEWFLLPVRMMPAVERALDAMPKQKGSPKRAFQREQSELVRLVRELRTHPLLVKHPPSPADLFRRVGAEDYAQAILGVELRRGLEDFERLRTMQGLGAMAGEPIHGPDCIQLPHPANPTPSFADLLMVIEKDFAEQEAAVVTRHEPRGQFLREMYGAFASSAIANRRPALLSHASNAVFGEFIEKVDVRELVKDLREEEARLQSREGEFTAR